MYNSYTNLNIKMTNEIKTSREVIEVPGIDTYPVGDESVSAITKVTGEEAVGNTLVRSCPTFAEVKKRYMQSEGLSEPGATAEATKYCMGTCAMRGVTAEQNQLVDVKCPEKNTLEALNRLGISPSETLIVAVTANGVGFADEFDTYQAAGKATTNPEGWRQANGFNAFFSDVETCPVLARRLADCGDLNIEFKTKNGKTIIGFMHLTRPNQYGEGSYPESQDGKSYVDFALGKAIERYSDVDLSSMRLVLRSAIEQQDFTFNFDSAAKLEEVLPGWAANGYIANLSNPNWQPGDEVKTTDELAADFRGIVTDSIRQTMQKLGIADSQFDDSHLLDTMHDPAHSSDQEDKKMGWAARRDLYIIAHKFALKN